ncbi:MAG: retron St85 family effector protein [Methylococcales bacterium]
MEDPRDTLLKDINIKLCRVELSDSPIVLLCGGKVPCKKHPDDPEPEISSLRHTITHQNTEFEIFRPEEITTWQTDGTYKNLMDFEADLASICSIVVIILESAGSIAELGAFSQLADLSNKLIVIKSREFNDKPSFINLGILRHIAENHSTSIKSYDWDTSKPLAIKNTVAEDVIYDIQAELDNLKNSSVLKLNLSPHIIVLVCELLQLFVALKEKELLTYIQAMGVDIDKGNLRGKLFLLEKFNLISRHENGGSFFYVRTTEAYHKLRLSAEEGKSIDALRVPVECIQYYESKKDRHRTNLIKEINSGVLK